MCPMHLLHEETQPVESKLEPEILSEKETAAVRACAADGCALLCDILRWGTVRLPENLTEHIEAMAVRCHALKMADAELMFRSIGTSLEESRSRRAVFRAEQLLGRICRTAAYLDSLQKQPVTAAMLGTFRNTYETLPHDLTLLPIGERKVTSGDHTGVIYYFLNMDEQAEQHFFTLSDLRQAYACGDCMGSRRTRPQSHAHQTHPPSCQSLRQQTFHVRRNDHCHAAEGRS